MQGLWKKGVMLVCAISVSACASIVGGRYQQVAVETHASDQSIGADCTLSNGEGDIHITAPATATVRRSAQNLNVTCKKDGQQVAQQSYEAHTRGMVWGNLLIGGLLGIVIDFSDKAAMHYPNKLSVSLPAAYASLPPATTDIAAFGGFASVDRRVSSSMFNAAQNIAAAKQCDRAIRVRMIDGNRAMFESQCAHADRVQIECEGAHCIAMQPLDS